MKAEIKHLELLIKKYGDGFDITHHDKGVRMIAGAMYHGETLQECVDDAMFNEGEQSLKNQQ
ncbi:hypothetical protein Phi18:3_gp063 [Cellulophaga phage phi18:3]|uniref:Uncharacterized protein n=1 Tax=Cellulophaga phage phi18:3 TaxID=1327983 RepID=S0A1B3_9CAUD|nr:hypothetical protein Phi18:3_gp063 [Cellulophaga phage phi18:3]AGO48575.1 hypothetical protein Phi18:3_gp063 [Cellulophaga phage phi18:3]